CVGVVSSVYGRGSNSRTRWILWQYLTSHASAITSEMWRKLLESSDGGLEEALQILATVRPTVGTDALHEHLGTSDAKSTAQAVAAIVCVEGPSRVRAFKKALADEDSKVRSAALKLMTELKDPAFGPFLELEAKSRSFSGRD